MSIRNTLLVLLFGGTLGGFCLREQQRGTLERFDRVHREFLKANVTTGGPAASMDAAAVIFARVDDKDQSKKVFESWPLNENDWQIILQNLPAYTPKAVALGVPFRFDKAGGGLEGTAKSIPALTVATEASTAAGDGPQVLPDSMPVLKVNGSINRIPEFKSIKPPAVPGEGAPNEIDLAVKEQKVTVEGDWCRVPLLARMGNKVVPTLALRALLEWANVPPKDITIKPGVEITAGKTLRIPIDTSGYFRYFLSLAPEVPALNADDFVLGKEQTLSELPEDDPRRKALDRLKSSLLWFGEDNVGARVLKLPNGTPVSPAELTARAIAAIQTDSYMRPLIPDLQWIPAAATLLFCLWLTQWRKSRLWPGALVAAVTLVGVSLYLYRMDHQWMPLGPSLAVLAATLVLSYLLPSPGWRTQTEAPAPTRRTVRTKPIEPAAPPPEPLAAAIIPATETIPEEELPLPPETEPATASGPDPWAEAFSRPVKGAKKKK
jgi:hypothetical protein